MERYFATAMAVFSFALSGGAQIGPMIAGFLIGAKGWRWFSILCAVLIGINLLLILFFLPETNYRRVFYENETAEEADKQAAVQTLEYKTGESTAEISGSSFIDLNPKYAGTYWRDLASFRNRGVEPKGLMGWPRQFSLPFRFLFVPQALFATISYGVFLGG